MWCDSGKHSPATAARDQPSVRVRASWTQGKNRGGKTTLATSVPRRMFSLPSPPTVEVWQERLSYSWH